ISEPAFAPYWDFGRKVIEEWDGVDGAKKQALLKALDRQRERIADLRRRIEARACDLSSEEMMDAARADWDVTLLAPLQPVLNDDALFQRLFLWTEAALQPIAML